jgi:hypothetical protein
MIPDSGKIRRGRGLYLKICTKCHRPSNIRSYSRQEWETTMGKMHEKDPLMMTGEESDAILYFLNYGSGGSRSFPYNKKSESDQPSDNPDR